MSALAVFGWIVIFCITLYCLRTTWRIFFGSLALMGRIAGECWFLMVVSALLCALCWYTWPFQVTLIQVSAS